MSSRDVDLILKASDLIEDECIVTGFDYILIFRKLVYARKKPASVSKEKFCADRTKKFAVRLQGCKKLLY